MAERAVRPLFPVRSNYGSGGPGANFLGGFAIGLSLPERYDDLRIRMQDRKDRESAQTVMDEAMGQVADIEKRQYAIWAAIQAQHDEFTKKRREKMGQAKPDKDGNMPAPPDMSKMLEEHNFGQQRLLEVMSTYAQEKMTIWNSAIANNSTNQYIVSAAQQQIDNILAVQAGESNKNAQYAANAASFARTDVERERVGLEERRLGQRAEEFKTTTRLKERELDIESRKVGVEEQKVDRILAGVDAETLAANLATADVEVGALQARIAEMAEARGIAPEDMRAMVRTELFNDLMERTSPGWERLDPMARLEALAAQIPELPPRERKSLGQWIQEERKRLQSQPEDALSGERAGSWREWVSPR